MKNLILGFLIGFMIGMYFSFIEYIEKIKTDYEYKIQHLTDYRHIDKES